MNNDPLPFTMLDAILLLGIGWVIRPFIDAIARRDLLAIVAGAAYLVIAGRRVVERLPSLRPPRR